MADRPLLTQFNLIVRDMEASVAFYRRLGLTILDTVSEWQPHHRSASTPNRMTLDLDSEASARLWDQGWSGSGRMGVLGFSVSSREAVDEIYTNLTGVGYRSEQPPYDASWGARYAIIQDPDGNAVGIMSPIDPAQRSAPPDPP